MSAAPTASPFRYDDATGTVHGPADYLRARGLAVLDALLAQADGIPDADLEDVILASLAADFWRWVPLTN